MYLIIFIDSGVKIFVFNLTNYFDCLNPFEWCYGTAHCFSLLLDPQFNIPQWPFSISDYC